MRMTRNQIIDAIREDIEDLETHPAEFITVPADFLRDVYELLTEIDEEDDGK